MIPDPSGRGCGVSDVHMHTLGLVKDEMALPFVLPAASGPRGPWPLCIAPEGRFPIWGSANPSSHPSQSFWGLLQAYLKTLLVNPDESLIGLLGDPSQQPLRWPTCPGPGVNWPQRVCKGWEREGRLSRVLPMQLRGEVGSSFPIFALSLTQSRPRTPRVKRVSCTCQRSSSQFTSLFFPFPTSEMFGSSYNVLVTLCNWDKHPAQRIHHLSIHLDTVPFNSGRLWLDTALISPVSSKL